MNTDNLIHLLKLTRVDKANEFCIFRNDGDTLVTRAKSDDGSLMTTVSMKVDFPIEETFAIKSLDKLAKIINLHKEEVNVKLKDNKLQISDSETKSEFVIADPKFFKVSKLKFVPTSEGEVTFDDNSIKKLIQVMKVMSDGDSVSVLLGDEEATFSIGSTNSFSNKVIFNIPAKKSTRISISELFYLNLQLVKQIIETNNNCKDAKMIIYKEGLVEFVFKYENIQAQYNLIMLEVN